MVARVVERGVIGVDLGGTKLLAGAVDADLGIHHRTNRPVYGLDQDGLVQMIVDAVEEVRTAVDGEIEAVGFGIPCTFDSRTGMAVQAANAPLYEIAFHEVMSERLGLPVVVDNDANVALLAEARHGAARDVSHAVLVALGTGIGSGLLLDGRIYRGSRGFASEIGHMVVDLHGPKCQGACPGFGCLEVLASGSRIGRDGEDAARAEAGSELGRRLASGREITGGIVTELAHDGDPVARSVLAEVGRRLGAGLVGVVNVFNPELIVIGGGAIAAGDLLLDPAREVVAERALPPMRDCVEIVPAHFGDESGMLGAALLAFDQQVAA
jgi:glucokinase